MNANCLIEKIVSRDKREALLLYGRHSLRCIFFSLSGLFLFHSSNAQEPLMAKANKVLTLSYGVTNVNRIVLANYLEDHVLVNSSGASYSSTFSNPIGLTFDYAISDYTSIGLGVNYYSFHLKEKRQDNIDTFDLDTKGYRMAIQARAMRYIIQGPKSVCYFFAGAGARFRSVKYNTTDEDVIKTANIHQTADASPSSYSPISLDIGIGLKFLVTKRIGFSVELGMMTGIAQLGLCYSLKNKWRRSNDTIGW